MVKEFQGCVLRKSVKIKNEIDICDRCLYFGSKGCKKKDNEKKKRPESLKLPGLVLKFVYIDCIIIMPLYSDHR